ncbi:PAXNEB protein superfamily [Taphrina deformans PYCC 5710]|uniref:Elongator complex protein 4 n=1 Tax=Taphrina deformans (strain PYCC 5710 / ATCC 11124 / CBS 356.35 / IMI 108563 / JCM 9778 / NBRC 8474) TaxID=1097556 RepID=R4X7Z2_TAPDE|nr:PAXNEB protein superfamily [Taphrina deformans PYCC 5710]|eukprot:CCG81590.1 PAXNEB protein superfamily [Taphrina deformans PYCC 5710]
MSFRKRERPNASSQPLPRGVRPSAANGVPVTSSGCMSLDTVLSGHGGMPVGSGLVIEENGTTDFSSVLLRYFAVEGLLQGQNLWIGGGVGEHWVRDLPAATDVVAEDETSNKRLEERMKIAWRYSSLGDFGSGLRAQNRPLPSNNNNADSPKDPYCHAYDLTKRMITTTMADQLHYSPPCSGSGDPFTPLLASLVQTIQKTTGIIRCVLPGVLSPAVYPPSASQSKYLVKFANNLRAILRAHPSRLLVMMSMPLDLYPRETSSTTWVELLMDGIIELTPLPPNPADRDGPQGLLKIHKVPLLERLSMEADLSFKVTRKRFSIEAWSLPALGEEEPREGGGTLKDVKPTNIDISF